jgi:hypothetical protein
MTYWKNKKTGLWIIGLVIVTINANAQFTQRIRGTLVDQVLQKPVPGATVSLPLIGKTTQTDSAGNFRFSNVPVGSQQIRISHISFKEVLLENLVVNAGKELVLSIAMENIVRMENEVIVKTNTKKNKPLNDMCAVSARAFTVEETQKYAAAVNDPLRMATGFPGVMAAEDGNNDIIIRGNAPTGLLWKMEGVDIPNPNHFSEAAGTGGGISILSA